MRAFGIFEGGGAKGLAHVGALRACEDYGIEFCGVAGASAGAILAALVAAGYRSKELFDPDEPTNPAALFSADLHLKIKGRISWQAFLEFAGDIRQLTRTRWPRLLAFWCWVFKQAHVKKILAEHKGLFDPESFGEWLDRKLERKLLAENPALKESRGFGSARARGERYRVQFADLPLPLKIVATDLTGGRVVEFSDALTPDVPVAKAVSASIAIPLFFTPVTIESHGAAFAAVDGGVISNFPAWLFDQERTQAGPEVPTLGFKLVVAADPPSNLVGGKMLPFLGRLLGVAVAGDPILETRQIDNLREVPLRVSASTMDFDMTPDQKVRLYKEGGESANAVFGTAGFPVEPIQVEATLEVLVETMRHALSWPDSLVRACVVCPTTRKTLRVSYRYAMDQDEDTDDQLELGMDIGASGRCWKSGGLVRADMVAAHATYQDEWGMTKYQQALVRKDIKALICAPIVSMSGVKLGVISLDSPDPAMLEHFQDPDTGTILLEGARLLAQALVAAASDRKD